MTDADRLSPQERAAGDIAALDAALRRFLGRSGRWSGVVHIDSGYEHSGVARYDGSIGISEIIEADPNERWRTMLHEVLHTFSPWYSRTEYVQARGWEEGVVEKLQRLLRSRVLAGLGVQASEEVLAQIEHGHGYNAYVNILESLRRPLETDETEFYLTLLAAPLPDRAGLVRDMGLALPPDERPAFDMIWKKALLSMSRPALKETIR